MFLVREVRLSADIGMRPFTQLHRTQMYVFVVFMGQRGPKKYEQSN